MSVAGILLMLFSLSIADNPVQELTSISESDNVQQIFNRANYLMDQGQFTDAMQMYKTIEQRGMVSGPLFANMAFIYIRQDSLGMAKYYLIKASEFPQTRSRANETLEYVDRALRSRSGTLPVLPTYAFNQWLRSGFGTVNVLFTSVIFINLSAIFLIFYWIRRRNKNVLNLLSAVTGGLAFLLLVTGIYLAHTDQYQSKAVVISKEVTLQQNPDITSEPIGLAYEGFTITLDHSQQANYPGWVYTKMSNGLTGWIQQRHVRAL